MKMMLETDFDYCKNIEAEKKMERAMIPKEVEDMVAAGRIK